MKKIFPIEWIVAVALGLLGVGSAFGRNIGDAYMAVYTCLAADGTPVEGQNVTLKIQKASNGYWFDFNDSAFKNESWGNKSVSLSEDTTEHRYYYSWTPPAGETAPEQYLYVYDNANTTYRDHQIERVDYQAIGNSTFAGGAVASVTGSVGSISGVTYPTNFASLSIDANGRLDVAKIAGTAQTARDIGASVLLSPGTGTGQVNLVVGAVALQADQAVNVVKIEGSDATDQLDAHDGNPSSASDIKTALEADGSKIDHLWEMTEDDGGVRRFTTNALEQAPTGGSAPTVVQIREEMDANSTQLAAIATATETTIPGLIGALHDFDPATEYVLADIRKINGTAVSGTGAQVAAGFEHFFDVETPSKTMNDVGTGGGVADWTSSEKTEIKTILGVTGTGTPTSTPSSGALRKIYNEMSKDYHIGP